MSSIPTYSCYSVKRTLVAYFFIHQNYSYMLNHWVLKHKCIYRLVVIPSLCNAFSHLPHISQVAFCMLNMVFVTLLSVHVLNQPHSNKDGHHEKRCQTIMTTHNAQQYSYDMGTFFKIVMKMVYSRGGEPFH